MMQCTRPPRNLEVAIIQPQVVDVPEPQRPTAVRGVVVVRGADRVLFLLFRHGSLVLSGVGSDL